MVLSHIELHAVARLFPLKKYVSEPIVVLLIGLKVNSNLPISWKRYLNVFRSFIATAFQYLKLKIRYFTHPVIVERLPSILMNLLLNFRSCSEIWYVGMRKIPCWLHSNYKSSQKSVNSKQRRYWPLNSYKLNNAK